MNVQHRFLLVATTILFSGAWTAFAQDVDQEATKAPTRPKVALRSVYLADRIGSARQIIIEGELGGEGKVTLDGNTCTVDQFGDTQICTEIFFPPVDVKIKQLRLADPSGQGRRVFLLEGELNPKDYRYYLIVPRRRSEAHRLVVDMGEDNRRVVSLERFGQASEDTDGKPELCKHAKFRAEKVDDKVVIYATGEHPTGGWKVSFEQLPIEIFPPQYRLVCIRPTGIVTQVITPFEVKTSFKSGADVKEVIVHDGEGRHKVPVE